MGKTRIESERYAFYFHNPRGPDYLGGWNRLVTIKIWVLVLLIGRVGSDICFNRTNQNHYPDLARVGGISTFVPQNTFRGETRVVESFKMSAVFSG